MYVCVLVMHSVVLQLFTITVCVHSLKNAYVYLEKLNLMIYQFTLLLYMYFSLLSILSVLASLFLIPSLSSLFIPHLLSLLLPPSPLLSPSLLPPSPLLSPSLPTHRSTLCGCGWTKTGCWLCCWRRLSLALPGNTLALSAPQPVKSLSRRLGYVELC